MLNKLADKIHNWAVGKGFWGKTSDGEKIALMHSELSECLEGLRHGNPPDEHCPNFSNAEIELADTIIRILDFASFKNFDIDGAIEAKMLFNVTRPHKHGKKF